MPDFEVVSGYKPCGDQPQAIEQLVDGIRRGLSHQTLLGITGSGKTATISWVIEKLQRPALVMAPNKTLAAQLYGEFKKLFPHNAVEYFVSYYDYYQPEAYLPTTDTFIEKDSSINEEIDRMRHSATRSVLSRRDVIVVASVSCIFGLGSPETYEEMHTYVQRGDTLNRDEFLKKLVNMLYDRNDYDFHRGTFRVRGDSVEVFPAYEDARAIRIEFFGDEVESITEIDPLRGLVLSRPSGMVIFPNSHYVSTQDRIRKAIAGIRSELDERIQHFRGEDKLLEAQRIEQRTMYDIEMLSEMGFCHGVENYSRWLDGRSPGETPSTLLNFYPDDFVCFVDESHVTVPQIGGMYRGDRRRKETLVDYGFRLPSALDNRPLRSEEWEKRVNQVVFVSATPGETELHASKGVVAEQVIRPTGLQDPEVVIQPARNQVEDLIGEIRERVSWGHRVLVTTLTKRMSEELTNYYEELGIRVRYLHSEIPTIERTEILRDLRAGEFDVLVGINLLREGLNLPEVSLVAILDADKEGFLRSTRSLIQTIGRAARNVRGKVILFADKQTDSIREAVSETNRRREIQAAYNEEHGITPTSVEAEISSLSDSLYEADYVTVDAVSDREMSVDERGAKVEELRSAMRKAAEDLDYERAAQMRDEIHKLEEGALMAGFEAPSRIGNSKPGKGRGRGRRRR
ncbi:MAG: excinuclease ABC subunit UvrB [bacterium]|nr:excinuclease ABC subunit UvrB [bacterium]